MILSEKISEMDLCRCRICNHFVSNNDCFLCSQEFPPMDYNTNENNVIHLSFMTQGFWVKVGCCCHLSLNLVSMDYSCLKISNNHKICLHLSDSVLKEIANNYEELFHEHLFPEDGGQIDGFSYFYIIQKGNKQLRQCFDCGLRWGMFDRLIDEITDDEDYKNLTP